MNIKKSGITSFVLAILTMAMFLYSFGAGYCSVDEEDKKLPMDKYIYDEFRKICEKCSTNSMNTGRLTMNIGGAEVSAKYAAYSKDIENKRIDVEYYGNKISIFVRPDEILRFYEKKNIIYSTKNKKNIAKFNHKKAVENMRENGKITRRIKGGETIYTIIDYTNDTNGKLTVDNASGLLKHSIHRDNDGGNVIEITYQNWEFKKPDFGLFREPSNTTFKSTDDSNISKEKSGETFDLIEK